LHAEALRTIGWCALEEGEDTRAMQTFESAATLDPAHAFEDHWAIGRSFERHGFFDEAAKSYAEARETAVARATALDAGAAPLTVAGSAAAAPYTALGNRTEKVRLRAEQLREAVSFAEAGLEERGKRLDDVRAGLDREDNGITALLKDLDGMDADLYKYLDEIPARALFPKKERNRVEELIARQERLATESRRVEQSMMELTHTRAWERSSEKDQGRALALWDRLRDAEAKLGRSQMSFLEGLKRRVSIREKELIADVGLRREDAKSLRTPLAKARTTLAEKKVDLQERTKKLAELRRRAEEAGKRVAALRTELEQASVAAVRQERAEEIRKIRLRADAFSLDEAQALDRQRQSRAGESTGGSK
jgi:hypothetical protein